MLLQGDNYGFRGTQMCQGKTQTAENGKSFSRAATLYWNIWVPPFGRVGKRSSVVSPGGAYSWYAPWQGPGHYLRDVPYGQPLPNSLNSQLSP